jgi:multidrug resistance efflux pump
MKKTREIVEQRHQIRVNTPINALIDDCAYKVEDWSIGGLQISGFHQKVKTGDCLPVQLQLNFFEGSKETINIKIDTLIEVIWLSARQGRLGAKFLNLTKVEKELLQYAIDRLVKGEITLIEGSTKFFDTSVAPVPGDLWVNQVPNTALKKARAKQILFSLVYLVIGGALGLYTVRSIYDSLVNMQIESATLAKPLGPVVAPVEPVISKEQGIVSHLYVHEGMSIKAGEPLFRTQNDDLAERDIDSIVQKIQLSRLGLAEAQAELQEAEALKQQETEKLQSYQAISQNKLDSARARVEALSAQYQIEKKNLERFATLLEEGAVSQQAFDSGRSKFEDAEVELQQAKAEYKVAQIAVFSAQKGNFYDGDKLISDLPHLTAKVNKLRQHVQIAAQKVSSLEQELNKQIQKLQISEPQRQYLRQPPQDQNLFSDSSFSVIYKAPFTGSVLKVVKPPSSPVRPRETVMVLQRELQLPTIDAYLTQEQANQITIGSQAITLIPALNKQYQARVTKIDRTGRAADQARDYQLQDSKDRPVYVQLTLDNISEKDKSQLIAAKGMPVILDLPKHTNIFERLAFWLR